MAERSSQTEKASQARRERAELTRELLAENERLKASLARLEQQLQQPAATADGAGDAPQTPQMTRGREPCMSGLTHYARRPMQYLELSLDTGQLFVPTPARNTEKLAAMGYFTTVPADATPLQCGECGDYFIDEYHRRSHGRVRHPSRFRSDLEQEEFEERLDRELERQHPLQTLA